MESELFLEETVNQFVQFSKCIRTVLSIAKNLPRPPISGRKKNKARYKFGKEKLLTSASIFSRKII